MIVKWWNSFFSYNLWREYNAEQFCGKINKLNERIDKDYYVITLVVRAVTNVHTDYMLIHSLLIIKNYTQYTATPIKEIKPQCKQHHSNPLILNSCCKCES